MKSMVVCIASHNEYSRRGEPALRRSLGSLVRAVDFIAARRWGVDLYVACCDDASSDGTADYIDHFFAGRSGFKLVRNGVPRYAGFCRNVAASLFAADVLCFLDPDDEYCEHHLDLCWQFLSATRDDLGRSFGALSTMAHFSDSVHVEWEARISRTIPITKAVRREAWEFVEGMPTDGVYKQTTCEDQFLMQKLGAYFHIPFVDERTVVYWNYVNSSFDRQLAKFRRPVAEYIPERDDPIHLYAHHQVRLEREASFLSYLNRKWSALGGAEQASKFAPRQNS